MNSRENAASDKSIHELQDLVKKIALKEKIEESREFAVDVERSLHSGLAAGTGILVLKTATGDHNFNIEVAITDQERALGLMFRRSLPENAGMLFIYDPPQPATMAGFFVSMATTHPW